MSRWGHRILTVLLVAAAWLLVAWALRPFLVGR